MGINCLRRISKYKGFFVGLCCGWGENIDDKLNFLLLKFQMFIVDLIINT